MWVLVTHLAHGKTLVSDSLLPKYFQFTKSNFKASGRGQTHSKEVLYEFEVNRLAHMEKFLRC